MHGGLGDRRVRFPPLCRLCANEEKLAGHLRDVLGPIPLRSKSAACSNKFHLSECRRGKLWSRLVEEGPSVQAVRMSLLGSLRIRTPLLTHSHRQRAPCIEGRSLSSAVASPALSLLVVMRLRRAAGLQGRAVAVRAPLMLSSQLSDPSFRITLPCDQTSTLNFLLCRRKQAGCVYISRNPCAGLGYGANGIPCGAKQRRSDNCVFATCRLLWTCRFERLIDLMLCSVTDQPRKAHCFSRKRKKVVVLLDRVLAESKIVACCVRDLSRWQSFSPVCSNSEITIGQV